MTLIYHHRGGHTHTHKHTHTYFGGTKVISRNQAHAGRRPACAWFKKISNNQTRS